QEHRQPVPAHYVITADAFRAAIAAQQPAARVASLLQGLHGTNGDTLKAAAELRTTICQLQWPSAIRDEIAAAHDARFRGNAAMAVRSSSIDEDSLSYSFAGMYDSVLNVQGLDSVLDAIKRVWSSLFSERVLAYRHRHRLPGA